MTTIRGKAPIELTFIPSVEAASYQQKIKITSGCRTGGQKVTVFGTLEAHCARKLILDLRKALRQVRDETVHRLNSEVTEAEKPL